MDYKIDFQSDDDFDCSNSYSDNYQSSSNASNQSQQGGRLSNTSTAGMSKAELRKTNKPIMEKRRRARINHCLNELKSLILEAMKKDPARHTKLEKADILEMTVKHLQSVQRQQLNMAIQTDPTVIHKFKTGFMECAEEVNRYINQLEGLDSTVKLRLNNHLNNCASNLDQISSMSQFTNGYSGGSMQGGLFGSTLSLPAAATLPSLAVTNGGASLFPSLSQDLNNNQGAPIQMGGVRLIPSRLPSGEFALIMPNSGTNQNLASSLLNPSRSVNFASWNPSNSSSGLPKSSLSPQFNDFTHNFKRLSAFSKPQATQNPTNNKISATTSSGYQQTCLATANYQHIIQPSSAFHTTTTTSPPLSPISTISSQNDDSITHNSSDYTNSQDNNNNNTGDSNVQQTSFKGAFNTPPSSADSSLIVTSATHLQQQQVSSTSSTSELNQSTASSSKADSLLLNSSNHGLKRSFSEATDSGIFSEEELPSAKKFYKDLNNQDNEEQDNMWRPW